MAAQHRRRKSASRRELRVRCRRARTIGCVMIFCTFVDMAAGGRGQSAAASRRATTKGWVAVKPLMLRRSPAEALTFTFRVSVEKWLPSPVRRCCSASGLSRNTRCSRRARSTSSSSSSREIRRLLRRRVAWASMRELVTRTRTLLWLQLQRPPQQLQRLVPTFRRRRRTPWRTIPLTELRRCSAQKRTSAKPQI